MQVVEGADTFFLSTAAYAGAEPLYMVALHSQVFHHYISNLRSFIFSTFTLHYNTYSSSKTMSVLLLLSWPVYAALFSAKLCLLLPLLMKWNFPLNSIPGPRWAAWTRFWWIRKIYTRQTADELSHMHRKYGTKSS
jgi:hypothetical protein